MSEILFSKNHQVVTLTINRPTRQNTLTSAAINGLRAALARANMDANIRCIVITGMGDTVFCAGGDLGRSMASEGIIAQHEANKELTGLFSDLRHLKKPIIARVNGHALGVGFALMLACDLAVAVDNIRMGCPELKVGVFPMLQLIELSRHCGPKRAMELVITAQQISAVDAELMGLLNYAVPHDDLDLKVFELTEQLASFSPAAIQLGRESFYATDSMTFDDTLNYLLTKLTLNLQTEDAKEGIQAFIAKRKPEWKGR